MASTTVDENYWQTLPDCILLEILSYLNAVELSRTAQTCRSWCRVSYDEHLWKKVFANKWKLPRNSGQAKLAPNRTSWRAEYKRLAYHAPCVEGEVLREHTDEVLHVSFANYGEMFASCSKDGSVVVWNSECPVSVRYKFNMKEFNWTYTQFSQFNETDTLLLVSGVYFQPYSTGGEIAVFSLEGGFELQCRVKNKPYDIFGTWYNDNYLLSSGHRFLGHHRSCSVLYLYKASQETDSEHKSVMSQLYKFYNKNGTLRSIMVANCQPCDGVSKTEVIPDQDEIASSSLSGGRGDDHSLSPATETCDDTDPTAETKCENLSSNFGNCDQRCPRDEEGEEEVLLDSRDKYLIFTTGSQSYVPHQIGFKKVTPFRFKERFNLNIEKQLAEHRERNILNRSRELPNYRDEESVSHLFDKMDRCVELHGHIIGMALSPDHRYLYVNCRPWPKGYVIEDPLVPPPIAQEIDIHVFDLVTLSQLDMVYQSHTAYTPNEECFFIFLDVSDSYVASGAEDDHGYLWDRHYQKCISRLPHSGVVNSVAFNPVNEEMLVTASDDWSLKVWWSKAAVRRLASDTQTISTDAAT